MLKRYLVLLLLPATAYAGPFGLVSRGDTVYFSAGQSIRNQHGHSVFRSLEYEMTGRSSRVPRWLRSYDLGARIGYSAVRQARSWFGYRFGDPDDQVRAESLYIFGRRERSSAASIRPYFDFGSGPMWSNRRIPAATSRLNFSSQLVFGVVTFASSRTPLRVGYRFSHVSNAGLTRRNPGLAVHTFFVGATIRKTSR